MGQGAAGDFAATPTKPGICEELAQLIETITSFSSTAAVIANQVGAIREAPTPQPQKEPDGSEASVIQLVQEARRRLTSLGAELEAIHRSL